MRLPPAVPRERTHVLTAEGTDPASMARGIALGAYDYLKKPVLEDELTDRIASALRSRTLGYQAGSTL